MRAERLNATPTREDGGRVEPSGGRCSVQSDRREEPDKIPALGGVGMAYAASLCVQVVALFARAGRPYTEQPKCVVQVLTFAVEFGDQAVSVSMCRDFHVAHPAQAA